MRNLKSSNKSNNSLKIKKAIDKAMKLALRELEYEDVSINDLKKIKIKSGIYIISAKVLADIKYPKGIKNHPKLNSNYQHNNNKTETVLYVGKSLNSLGTRIRQHFNLKKNSKTYSLKLDSWQKGIFDEYNIKIIEIPNEGNTNSNLINLIENYFWDNKNPIFGKK